MPSDHLDAVVSIGAESSSVGDQGVVVRSAGGLWCLVLWGPPAGGNPEVAMKTVTVVNSVPDDSTPPGLAVDESTWDVYTTEP